MTWDDHDLMVSHGLINIDELPKIPVALPVALYGLWPYLFGDHEVFEETKKGTLLQLLL